MALTRLAVLSIVVVVVAAVRKEAPAAPASDDVFSPEFRKFLAAQDAKPHPFFPTEWDGMAMDDGAQIFFANCMREEAKKQGRAFTMELGTRHCTGEVAWWRRGATRKLASYYAKAANRG